MYGLPATSFAEVTASAAGQLSDIQAAEHADATEAAVLKLLNDSLNVAVSTRDISVAHRLPKKRSNPAPAAVVVRFNSVKIRDAVYRARTALKGQSSRLFINEHLIKGTATLFHLARNMVKDKRLLSTWTSGGSVYVKRSSDPYCRPVKVTSEAELRTDTLLNPWCR